MRAIIVHAGVGGLTTALFLNKHGIDCEVFEQAPAIQQLVMGINLMPQAIASFDEIGLLGVLEQSGIAPDHLFYRTGQRLTGTSATCRPNLLRLVDQEIPGLVACRSANGRHLRPERSEYSLRFRCGVLRENDASCGVIEVDVDVFRVNREGRSASKLMAIRGFSHERGAALPREARQSNEFNALRNCLGKKRLIVFQDVSEWPPKLERGDARSGSEYKWHATWARSIDRRSGTICAQTSIAEGQRVRNAHPEGGLRTLGGSPLTSSASREMSASGSAIGTALSSARVYGCKGLE